MLERIWSKNGENDILLIDLYLSIRIKQFFYIIYQEWKSRPFHRYLNRTQLSFSLCINNYAKHRRRFLAVRLERWFLILITWWKVQPINRKTQKINKFLSNFHKPMKKLLNSPINLNFWASCDSKFK